MQIETIVIGPFYISLICLVANMPVFVSQSVAVRIADLCRMQETDTANGKQYLLLVAGLMREGTESRHSRISTKQN